MGQIVLDVWKVFLAGSAKCRVHHCRYMKDCVIYSGFIHYCRRHTALEEVVVKELMTIIGGFSTSLTKRMSFFICTFSLDILKISLNRLQMIYAVSECNPLFFGTSSRDLDAI